jgi:hypothetical protein
MIIDKLANYSMNFFIYILECELFLIYFFSLIQVYDIDFSTIFAAFSSILAIIMLIVYTSIFIVIFF